MAEVDSIKVALRGGILMARSGDDTWRRLLEWTGGQKGSERLAAHILRADGFEDIDPSHPLGGPDGTKDALARKAGKKWTVAVYFPRGQQTYKDIKKKFKSDLRGIGKDGTNAMAFITNQELTLSERERLRGIPLGGITVEIYHLERIAQMLDSPELYGVRLEFLDIQMSKEEQASHFEHLAKRQEVSFSNIAALITGGDSFCYLMLFWFDMENHRARQIAFRKVGKHPLREVSARIYDLATQQSRTFDLGTITAVAIQVSGQWDLGPTDHARYNITFHALNGFYTQFLRLARVDEYWAAATRVVRGNEVILEEIDPRYVAAKGTPVW
jgi:hypothetical protein